jgi:hypothetical protein
MGRRPSVMVGGISLGSIEAEFRRKMKVVSKLARKRQSLVTKLAAVDAEIRALGMSSAGTGGAKGRSAGRSGGGSTGRVRPSNTQNLADALQALLKGKTMGVTEAAAAVQKAGYKTNAENFRTIVNQCLIKNRTMFKKVSRGQYTAS